MSTRESTTAWDLSPVLELVNALSPSKTDSRQNEHHHVSPPYREEDSTAYGEAVGASLGDFSKIWQYLGVPASVLPSTSKTTVESGKENKHNFSSKQDYTSDGAIRYGSRPRERKTVTWRDDTSIDDGAPGSSPERDAALSEVDKKLTKSQRKKLRRRERKAKEASSTAWTVSESEADNVFLQTPARKASVHSPSQESVRRHSTRPTGAVDSKSGATEPVRVNQSMRQASQPDLLSSKPIESERGEETTTAHWPVVSKVKVKHNGFLPSSVSPKTNVSQPTRSKNGMFPEDTLDAVRAVQEAQAQLRASTPSRTLPNRAPMIEPKIVRSGEDRHWALLLKLINEFPQDRKYLVSPMNMTTHNNDSAGLHLFVDASNIFIGFNEQLKRSRNIPLHIKVPPVDLSFDALALLMERRRPIAKRTLVGSTPRLPAFDKAEAIGYECNILEKVYKARELTERQIYFKERDNPYKTRAARDGRSDDGGYSSGGGYTSEPGAAAAGKQYAPARMIEQGVDELLHMKMAQSLLDFDQPATMVVATGDAAQAEYSDGFKAMIERALRKGWTVELVSWSKNISSLYLRKDFQITWGDRFKVVYLDDYAEELLDM